LGSAVRFLMYEAGVPLARLVPYNAQLVMITAYFGVNPTPAPDELRRLVRWFWLTSWSGYFAGANTTQIKVALQEMKDFAEHGVFPNVTEQPARRFPNRFDMRSARVRSLLLWQLREFHEPIDNQGQPINVLDILEHADTQAFRHIVSRRTPLSSSPANRIVMPTPVGVTIKSAILSVADELRSEFCLSNGIPDEAIVALERNDDEEFIRLRADYLADGELSFMRDWGAKPLYGSQWGEADIDTE